MADKIILENSQIEFISKIIGDAVTGSQLTELFASVGINENSSNTKWRRISETFSAQQTVDGSSNNFLRFIQKACSPIKFINKSSEQLKIITDINQYLCFSGLQLDAKGQYHKVSKVSTASESEKRYKSLLKTLQARNVHHTVLYYCQQELLVDNYFHAVFEAAKSLYEAIREKTGLKEDGNKLIDEAFNIQNPRLVLNSLETDTEKNIQIGYMNMLKGITSMVRNVRAHTPKVKWIENESDAVEILCIISYLYKILDEAIVVPSC